MLQNAPKEWLHPAASTAPGKLCGCGPGMPGGRVLPLLVAASRPRAITANRTYLGYHVFQKAKGSATTPQALGNQAFPPESNPASTELSGNDIDRADRTLPVRQKPMKTLVLLLFSFSIALAEENPKVDVYMIRKFDSKSPLQEMPEVILEVSNPTERTVYVSGDSIERPMMHIEAKRGDRWLRIPNFLCGTGTSSYPLRPGTKMLVTIDFPWEESTARFRFFFFDGPDTFRAKITSVWSRGIEKKELGDLLGTTGELTSERKLENPETDEEMNKRSLPPESDPVKVPIEKSSE